ncbi:hypothetical protein [Mucilaginibacter paludis]|uniref:Uncharacterized protein n=1 Tax=Mucilaginibacter paludis DSM 18603 TaxID=714943 RepID=H1YAW8_9SPHI|nr:hypothetical protein [Mucilaginibacter paludis]EHQ30001.1 hypothetical protein Mucpa_5941 [Mucilaginibacter paludis DSM 18603]
MKRLLLIALLILPSLLRAQVKQQIARVDTIPGHGYEIMYVGKHEKLTTRTSDGEIQSLDYFNSIEYNWPKAKFKIDSIYNLKQGWRLSTTAQLKTIFKITQAIMNQKDIRIGSYDFIGINGLFWCNNSPDGSFNDLDNLAVAGSQNSREFEVERGSGKDYATSDEGYGLVYKEQLLMVRKY